MVAESLDVGGVSMLMVQRTVSAARSIGIDVDGLLAVEQDHLGPPLIAPYVSSEFYLELWEEVMKRGDDRALPIRAASCVRWENDNLLAFACGTAKTLLEAIDLFMLHVPLYTSVFVWHFEKHKDGRATLSMRRRQEFDRPGAIFADEFRMGDLIMAARWMTSVVVKPLEVHFAHAEPPCAAEIRNFFGCPVIFGSPPCALLFSPEQLALPCTRHDPWLAAYAQREIESVEKQMASEPASVAGRVEQQLVTSFGTSAPSLEEIARRLGMSERTLRRHLAIERTSFRELVESARRQHAERLLAASLLTPQEIGFWLGFSDQSAFTRAFRRWTGQTPTQYRASSFPPRA
jgi:AraC-like DNA-binding protein